MRTEPLGRAGAGKVARRQSSPLPGKLSARPAGKPGFSLVVEEFATIPFPPLSSRSCTEGMRFLRHGGIYRSDVVCQTKPWGGTVPPPAGRPRAQVKERVGRNILLIVRDEFRPAIP
jgi:hypothetical protein